MHRRNGPRHRLLVWTAILVVAALGMSAVPAAPFGATRDAAKVVYGQEVSQQQRKVFLPLITREAEAQTGTTTSSQSNFISTPSGAGILAPQGSVPRQQNNADNVTTFSIETGIAPPAPLPAGVQPVSPVVKFGPEGFTFASPIHLTIPIQVPAGVDLTRLRLLRYAPDTGAWVQYPLILQDNAVSFAAYDLGFAVVVLAPPATSGAADEAAVSDSAAIPESPVIDAPAESAPSSSESDPGAADGEAVKDAEKDAGVPAPDDGDPLKDTGADAENPAVVTPAQSVPLAWISGGVRWNQTSCPSGSGECRYNFTIIQSTATGTSPVIFNSSCTQAGGALRCIVMATGSTATGTGSRCYHRVDRDDSDPPFYSSSSDYCVFPLPRGNYQLCVEAWETPMVIPSALPLRRWTYSLPARATVDRPMYRNIPSYTAPWIGTRPIVLDPGGTWQESAACPRPAPTIPVGTGELQATLSWVNISSRTTDLDLHLYGPNGLHIFYGNKGPVNNLRLDRDWLRELGNATENIYSVGSPIPRGDYRLTVRLYSGAATSYSVRFLFRGSVRSYSNSISRVGEEQEIVRFTVP